MAPPKIGGPARPNTSNMPKACPDYASLQNLYFEHDSLAHRNSVELEECWCDVGPTIETQNKTHRHVLEVLSLLWLTPVDG